MSDFGVYYTCYTEIEAVEYSLEVLYSIYPECPVYLVSDGGRDYSYLEKKHPFLKTKLERDSRGWCQGKYAGEGLLKTFKDDDTHQKLYDTALTWIERNKAAVDYAQKPYMLMMETDVLVRGKLTMPKNAKLTGPLVNSDQNGGWRKVLAKIDGALDIYSWGWPYIYESAAFNEVYDFVKNNDGLFHELIYSDYRFGAAGDVTIPVLFGAVGYRQSINPEVTECLRNPAWKNTTHPLLHQYREKYPENSSTYDGTHAKEKQ